jgi:hypothetical protein
MQNISATIHVGKVSISTPTKPVVVEMAAVITLPNGKSVISFEQNLKHPFDGYEMLGFDKKFTPFIDISAHGSLFRHVAEFFTISPLIADGEVGVVMANQSERLIKLGRRVADWRDGYR